ncbi:LysR family transcriptional regulator [Falsiroseomonas selenitidurans]|uniref:LysR family transcriptional regulator n=1 Tax=Falsiroseomonas selenitidurans TaxID=2716335 RepID=A0ABX1DWM7_9PROT|nr:LysR family transcriptional regulator [Falsiroseomonas selenitidurans]NKC29329.1 LysR family transcriptional regulator [Falsiroseomonas selenitidurans]
MLPPGLRCFLAVAQAGSMREAAQRLRLAQSAISRRIQQLEEDLGVQLLERGARGVGLTPAGEILLHHGREATQLTERLRADLDALRGVRRGHVVLRLVESFAASGLAGALAAFRSAYPAVTLDVAVVGSEAILAALHDRTCHLGIAFNPGADPEVEVLASAPEPLAVMLAPGHRLADAASLTLADLAGLPLVAPSHLGSSRALFDTACRAARAPIRPVLETNSAHVAAAFVADGKGVAVMVPRVLALHLALGKVRAVPLADPLLNGGRVALLARRGRRLPAAAEALSASLARALEQAG